MRRALSPVPETSGTQIALNAASRLKDVGKKLVVYKVGRWIGAEAAAHTGALAGEDRVFDAFFRQYGAIRVDRYDPPTCWPGWHDDRPNGKRLAVLTIPVAPQGWLPTCAVWRVRYACAITGNGRQTWGSATR